MSFDWKSVVRTIAPILGGSLGGPVGAAAMGTIAKVLLGKDTAGEAELEIAMQNATPEQLAELKKADNDFKIRMEELGFKREELMFKDVADARSLFGINIWPQIILSGLYTIGYFIVLVLIMTDRANISPELQATANLIIGILTAAIPQILQFWFGSSTGSKEKTLLMNGVKK